MLPHRSAKAYQWPDAQTIAQTPSKNNTNNNNNNNQPEKYARTYSIDSEEYVAFAFQSSSFVLTLSEPLKKKSKTNLAPVPSLFGSSSSSEDPAHEVTSNPSFALSPSKYGGQAEMLPDLARVLSFESFRSPINDKWFSYIKVFKGVFLV
jgi:hypothetical protein